MKLLIISNMAHYHKDGQIVGWGPAVQEIDHLAQLFDNIRHIGCLHAEPAPPSALPYSSSRVQFLGVPPAGGETTQAKLEILRLIPLYLKTMLQELPRADVVHVRCPANISMLAIVLLTVLPFPRWRWVKFAGSWMPNSQTPRTSLFQRWWLNRGLHRGLVTVNGVWPDQPAHVHSFLNPCLTEADLQEGAAAAADKTLSRPLRLLFTGFLARSKGVDRAITILERLQQRGIDAVLEIAGGGPEEALFQQMAAEKGLVDRVIFHGWLPRPALGPLYARSEIMVFPSLTEGWPKVLSEAMAYGVVPVSSDVGSIGQYLSEFQVGHAFDPDDLDRFVDAIAAYVADPAQWQTESRRAVESARLFSYDAYLDAVQNLLQSAGAPLNGRTL